MSTDEFIQQLKGSMLYAECDCGEEFRISKAILFDGTKPFPTEALEIQQELQDSLKDREAQMEKQLKLAGEKAMITSKSVNIGKNLEKILPTMKDFKWELPDARFLADPIDLITFNGLSAGKINSISFIEVKSGNAKLNAHQKAIKDAVADHKVIYKVMQ